MRKKGGRTPTDVHFQPPRLAGAARVHRDAPPVGVPPRLFGGRANAPVPASGALPGTWLKNGCCPFPPVPVQRSGRRPVIVPAGRFPEAARERSVSLRPRAPHSLRFREYPRPKASFTERDSMAFVTEMGTTVKNVTVMGTARGLLPCIVRWYTRKSRYR
jgi:hypothetical protein